MALPLIGLGTMLSMSLIPLAVKLLAGLGFGFVAYEGLSFLFDSAFEFIVSQFDALPMIPFEMLQLAKFDVAITMIFSAYSVRLLLMGVNSSGVMTKFGARGSERFYG